VLRRVLCVLALLSLSACLNSGDSKDVDAASAQIFARIEAKQYDAIYDAAAPELQASMPKPTFVAMMQRIDRKLGACPKPSSPIGWRVNATTGGYFSTRNYKTTCANGELTQSVTIVLRNGQAKLAGYFAGSPLLLTD